MLEAAVDYKKAHCLVGNLFEPIKSLSDWDACRLPDHSVQEFHRAGFIRGPKVLTDDQIGQLREALERIRLGRNRRTGELYEVDAEYVRDPEQHVFHFLGAWMIDEFFHDIVFHAKITAPASQLLGSPRVRLWHDQVFYKPPRHPGVVTWHQDYSYWTRSVPARHLTCWIGLDDSTIESGCVHFVPESHRWDLLPKLALLRDMDAIKGVLAPQQLEKFHPEPMILKAGECSFHHSHTVHGSLVNRANHPRRAIVLNFMHPETRSADGTQPLLSHTPIVPEGQIIAGDNFPIVYDADALRDSIKS